MRFTSRHGRALCFASAFTLVGLGAAGTAKADCKAAIDSRIAEHKRLGTVTSAVKLPDKKKNLAVGTCLPGASCVALSFFEGPSAPATPALEPDYQSSEGWKELQNKDGCHLFEFVATKKAPVSKMDAPAPTPLIAGTALAEFRSRRSGTMPSARGVGTAQIDSSAIANEALQIMGQIVVDRATAKAYQALGDKLSTLLHCDKPATHFPATCAALASLRIEDLAMIPGTLLTAFAQDMYQYAGPKNVDPVLAGALTAFVVPLIVKPHLAQDAAVRGILESLERYLQSRSATFTALNVPERAVAFGVLAYAKCLESSDLGTLGKCDAGRFIDQLAESTDATEKAKNEHAKAAGHALAQRLLSFATATKLGRAQVTLAVDTLFATGCMLLVKDESKDAELACPGVDGLKTLTGAEENRNRLAFANAFADAAITRNGARTVVVAAKFVDLELADQEAQEKDDATTRRTRPTAPTRARTRRRRRTTSGRRSSSR